MKPIDEMTPEEIRLEIAKRKGIMARPGFGGRLVYDDYASEVVHPLPNWPTDIAAAWELFCEFPSMAELWRDVIRKGEFVFSCKVSLNLQTIVFVAPTAPLAICKAWLAWKRGQDE